MLLAHCTWPEVEAYLGRSRGMIVPIGSTEQHGPTGLIGTDHLTAEAIARGAGDAADALVAPVIAVGMAQHHMAFPGTMTLRPSTLIAVVRDTVLGLAEHGFRRFLFVNGHGGNVPTVKAAFYEIEAEVRAAHPADPPDLRCQVVNWYEGGTVAALLRELFGGREGAHATPGEISVTRALLPEIVKDAVPDPAIAPISAFFGARDFRRRHPDGRMGSDPTLAAPEHGRRIIAAAVSDVAGAYRRLMADG